MGLESFITDPSNHKKAHVDCPSGEKQGLIVSTRELKDYRNLIQFFANPNFGIDLNINTSFSSNPSGVVTEFIYDADNEYWDPNVVSGGKWQPTNADQNHTEGGFFSLRYDKGDAGNTFELNHPLGDFDLTDYTTLSMWIYIDKDWGALDSVSVYGWDGDANAQVGTEALLENYITTGSLGVWQKATIPLSLMELPGQTVLDAFRFSIVAVDGKSPKFYIDDMCLEGFATAGVFYGPQVFTVRPPVDEWYHIKEINTTVAAVTAFSPNVLLNGTMPYMDYSSFFGVEMEGGLTYQSISNNAITFSFTARSIGEILSVANTTVDLWGTETSTFMQIKVKLYSPILLKGNTDDEMRIIINDDLSELLQFRSSVGGLIENRVNPPFPTSDVTINRALS
jgi:hypothetical protein